MYIECKNWRQPTALTANTLELTMYEYVLIEPAFTDTPIIAEFDNVEWMMMTHYAACADAAVNVTPSEGIDQ
tara:strand:- start:135 stop:350 length:216 start_codon:yes stop_codon:yes gene_type:complete